MSMNSTPSASRVHIGFFGRRNAGKSSVVNAVTGQKLSVVSDVKGTTTDPVQKAMELLPLGPVVIIDTPGLDDEGELGEMRVQKAKQILNKVDIAVLVIDAAEGEKDEDRRLEEMLKAKAVPYVKVFNKCDLAAAPEGEMSVSAATGEGIHALKEKIASLRPAGGEERFIVKDLLEAGDLVLLVTPIDEAAPKGRIILPQQQTIRDILDADAAAIVVKEDRIRETIASLGRKPKMVITDSQVFDIADAATPEDIPLTSFSVLMARYKGLLDTAVRGIRAVETLKDGDTVLIAEGCTHHRQCNDIGSVKIPRWLRKHTGKEINIELCSGNEFPEDLAKYALVIHCGGCMLTERAVRARMEIAEAQGVPMTNYGIAIAYMKGILERSIELFPHLKG
ncbi:MAG: [Clostridia bacterium]|nr:[FeFe] hydrogenase H-cluster maturation GTPase HydF [Clostridia bacterium]